MLHPVEVFICQKMSQLGPLSWFSCFNGIVAVHSSIASSLKGQCVLFTLKSTGKSLSQC